jgi:hypothetical protein
MLLGSTAGIITSTMPTRPRVYAYRDTTLWSRTTTSSTAARITDASVQASWRPPVPAKMPGVGWPSEIARARSRRRRKPTPRPLTSATAGIRTGSAYGAVNRTTRCRPRKMAVSSADGTQNVGDTWSSWFASTVAP